MTKSFQSPERSKALDANMTMYLVKQGSGKQSGSVLLIQFTLTGFVEFNRSLVQYKGE